MALSKKELRGLFVSMWGISEDCLMHYLGVDLDDWGEDEIHLLRQLYLDLKSKAIDPDDFIASHSQEIIFK